MLIESDTLRFPPAESASEEGLVAVGGDASAQRLLLAYSQGIFPWPHRDDLPLLWFSPDPRFVLLPQEVHLGRSLRKAMRRSAYEIRIDSAFTQVIQACAEIPRSDQDGTWITPELQSGYVALHHAGYAHSVEAWQGDALVGGLYGVSLGAAFFGESMFAQRSDASKVAFLTLVAHCLEWGFHFIDCQVPTEHLARFGAHEWPRQRFLTQLAQALEKPTRQGLWQSSMQPADALTRLDALAD